MHARGCPAPRKRETTPFRDAERRLDADGSRWFAAARSCRAGTGRTPAARRPLSGAWGLYVPTYAPFPARQGRQGPPGSVPPSARRTAHRSAGSNPAPPLPDLRHRPYVTTEIERLARRRGKPPLHAASCPDAPPRRPRSRYSTPCSRDTTPPSRACATYAATNCAFSSRKRR